MGGGAHIAAYGRLAQDPRTKETRNGSSMAWASMAVDVEMREDGAAAEDAGPWWLKVMAFGRVAECLARHSKGDPVSVSGRLQRSRWTDRTTGEQREDLQVIADAVVSARSVRPGGGKKRQPERRAPPDFDDGLPEF